MTKPRIRLAFIVSHPIQYYAPLYQRLAKRGDLAIKVFYTWHCGDVPVKDTGFKVPVAWDIPLTEGYEFELVPNVSTDRGTHRFFGLNNPSLIQRVMNWQPNAVHITGWAWLSHLLAMRAFNQSKMPTLFRGDSHLLNQSRRGPQWWIKRAVLKRVFSWPTGFLVVGKANRNYFEAFGVAANRLYACPHSVDVARFAEPSHVFEREAVRWRQDLGITPDRSVLLFAGKLESKKRPIELMHAVLASPDRRLMLLMVGSGELDEKVKSIASTDPDRFRVLPFQNQSRMPVVYRLSDLFILPSAFGETWGLAVNESLACARPVLVSDAVGCAADVVDASCGRIFSWVDSSSLPRALHDLTDDHTKLLEMRQPAGKRAWDFDLTRTENALMAALHQVLEMRTSHALV